MVSSYPKIGFPLLRKDVVAILETSAAFAEGTERINAFKALFAEASVT